MTLSKDTIHNTIQDEPAVLLYFSSRACSVCHAIKPKLFEAVSTTLPLMRAVEITSDEHIDICSEYSVFSMPTAIVFLDGREFYRVSRNFSISQFVDQIKRPYSILTSSS